MANLAPTLEKKEFKNWVKGSLALLFTKEGLAHFVSKEINRHHKRLLQLIQTANVKNKCNCTINSLPQCTRSKKHNHTIVPDPTQLCSRGVCHILMDGICKDHRYRGPSWKNTDAQKWAYDEFEVAKCYMAPDGYSGKSFLSETDFNGILSVIINNLSFTTLIQDNLATEPNICTEARKVGREIRHTPDHLLSDSDLQNYIDVLIRLLCDPVYLNKDPSAQAAVMKLKKLKTNDLTIYKKDITDALRDNIRDEYSKEHRNMLQKINDHFSDLQTDSVAEIDRITAVRKTELEELANKLSDNLNRNAELKMHEIKQAEKTKEKSDYEKKLKDFQEELIASYRENESMIPAAPLDYGNKVPIEDLYVLPPMRGYGKPNIFELGKYTQKQNQIPGNAAQETLISTISPLFTCTRDDVRYKKIYITANAGFGKTSLSQKLTMIWCQAHSPLTSLKEKYEDEELDAMKYFDFLFLLHLRDYQSKPLCNLDDLIMEMLSNYLSRNTLYTKDFLQGLLHEKKCLILIDGLDEWGHPETCIRTPAVPHNNHPDNCTVVTTSRPWKLGTIGLSENNIDRLIEISELDDHTRLSLEANAIRILNKRRLNLARKFRIHFDQKVKSAQIGDIICIPYILLQLMCLFFGGCPIGKSKCEIYSNITEFTLTLGLKKPNLPKIHVQSKNEALVPKCMEKNKKCCRYFDLLMKLGKLAFCALFSKHKESSLIFDKTFARKILTKLEIEFCLKVGLLCQTRDNSNPGIKQYEVFFQHKSIQEFFSALYITYEWQNESVKSTVVNFCSSLSRTLELENLFVFVCGMKSEVYTCIFNDIQMKVDLATRRYTCRTDMYSGNDDREIIDTYLSMQLPCMQESIRNGNKNCPIYLNVVLDRFLSVNFTELKTILNIQKGHLKSLLLLNSAELVLSLKPGVFISLEALRVERCREEPIRLADIFTESAHTLKFLALSRHSHLSDISIKALIRLTCLQSLYLDNVHMTHINLEYLYDYISRTTSLIQLQLVGIHCSDTKYQYLDCDVTLDLQRLYKLKTLHLYLVPCRQLHVNQTCLEKLVFLPLGEKMTSRASNTLWKDLVGAPVLSSLTLSKVTSCQEIMQTVPTLHKLQYLEIRLADMEDFIPNFLPATTKLERVVLDAVTMSPAAWTKLFLSVDQLSRSISVKLSSIIMTSNEWREQLLSVADLSHPVTVELSDCQGPSRTDWYSIVDEIKTKLTLLQLRDLRISSSRFGAVRASLTLTKN